MAKLQGTRWSARRKIKVSMENSGELWRCPVVYRMSKTQLDPDYEYDGILRDEPEPSLSCRVLGVKDPICVRGGWLVEDTAGYWHWLNDEQGESLQTEEDNTNI